jgi:hypothetical protein
VMMMNDTIEDLRASNREHMKNLRLSLRANDKWADAGFQCAGVFQALKSAQGDDTPRSRFVAPMLLNTGVGYAEGASPEAVRAKIEHKGGAQVPRTAILRFDSDPKMLEFTKSLSNRANSWAKRHRDCDAVRFLLFVGWFRRCNECCTCKDVGLIIGFNSGGLAWLPDQATTRRKLLKLFKWSFITVDELSARMAKLSSTMEAADQETSAIPRYAIEEL